MKVIRYFWRDLPLNTKIASLTSILIVLVVLALTLLSINRERAADRAELESQARLMLDTLPLTLRDQMYLLEVDELSDVSEQITTNPNVTLFRIYNRSGVLITDGHQIAPTFSLDPDPYGETLVDLGRDDIAMEWQADQLLAGRVVYLGNQKLGAMSIGLSTAPLNAKITQLTYQSIALVATSLLLGITLATLVARQITRPIDELSELAEKMSGGDLTARFTRHRKDEVGRLGRAFNQMSDAIHTRETELRDLARGLEAAVKDRTAELEQQNIALVAARKQAEESSRLKSEFLASMSHELRTPLNAIMGFSQVLEAGVLGDLNEKQTERVSRIFKSGQTLLNMINDILDLSKIEAGRMEIVEHAFVLPIWIEDLRTQLEGMAAAKALTFEIVKDAALPDQLVGDEVRLKQIATNLLSNAIKFTETGKVSLELKKVDTSNWAMVVRDTGIGIPPHAIEFIFDEFRQVDGSTQRKHGGTGLGLAIVRKLAVMMGGQLKVTSTVNEGSEFSVILPLKVAESVAS